MKKIKTFIEDMWYCFINEIFPVVGFISFVLVLMLGFAVQQYKAHEWKCEMKSTVQGLEWSYKLGEGCMVKTENGWIDYNKLIYKKEVK